jgi:polysaccharide deacetylase family protein (PEP-CTERM system associated)
MSEAPNASSATLNAMTVDVEEHFQVSGFERVVPRENWSSMPSRVVDNTKRLLDLFDESGTRATFFILGWVAKRHQGLVRTIAARGHEIASHGYSHRLVYTQHPTEFKREVMLSRRILEDAAGTDVIGYRAASFSIGKRNLWALDVIAEAGFRYDSSLFPVVHDRYGIPGAPRRVHRLSLGGGLSIIEVPPSTLAWGALTLPVLGGGYLRTCPISINRWAVERLNRREGIPAVVYVHPWEVDPDQPVIRAPLLNRWRHYHGLRTTESKIRDLSMRFRFGTVRRVIAAADVVAIEQHHGASEVKVVP